MCQEHVVPLAKCHHVAYSVKVGSTAGLSNGACFLKPGNVDRQTFPAAYLKKVFGYGKNLSLSPDHLNVWVFSVWPLNAVFILYGITLLANQIHAFSVWGWRYLSRQG